MLKIGNATFDDVLTSEILIPSYDYNSNTPRFFSKKFRELDPGRYDVPLRIAVGGSSSAPAFFDPEPWVDKFGVQSMMVDGGIICNDPALYAYILARNFHNKTNVRIVSLGTGESYEEA